jgi:hypothetical protein
MSKTLPGGYTDVDGIEFKTRSPIRSADWAALAAMQNYLYSRRGERIGGLVFENPWRNNTSTFTPQSTAVPPAANATYKDLDEWVPVFTARRRINELTSSATRFSLDVFGRDYQIRAEIIDAEDGVTNYGTFTFINGTTTRRWDSYTFGLKDVVVTKPDGTPRKFALSLSARRNTTEAEIHQIQLKGKFYTAAELPDKEYLWERYPVQYTFTPAGATGHLGPTQAQVDAAYAMLPQSGLVSVISPGYQCFDVPFTGIWQITAAGAGFNGVSNQRGATAIGIFSLERGQQLRMIVGQTGSNIRCGSGGSFVGLYDRDISTGNIVTADNIRFFPLIIGGGAGGTLTANNAATAGQAGLTGSTSSTGALGGTGPNGGTGTGFAIGGAGWLGNGTGTDGIAPFNVSQSYTNGGEGNLSSDLQSGGFGGGGTGRLTTNWRFGGGGGWGGGAASQSTVSTGWAGGGASYVNTTVAFGATVSITSGNNIGDGYITLEYVGQ